MRQAGSASIRTIVRQNQKGTIRGSTQKVRVGSGVIVAIIGVALAAGIWYAFFHDDAPAPVSIEEAVVSVSENAAAETGATEADVTQLQSDDNRRDRASGRQALETVAYPTASFQLTEPVTLPEVPQEGVTFSIVAHGGLTFHGVTQTVDIPLQAQRNNGFLVIVGSHEIVFSDYDINPPSAPLVLAVNDFGTLELQLVLTQG